MKRSQFTRGYALVIGIGADLPVTVNDATAVAGLLRDPQRCAYPPDQVWLLVGEEAHRQAILSALDRLAAEASPEATAIVYFSGHGLETPEYYLLPYSRELERGSALTPPLHTAISGQLFTEKLRAIRARRLLVLLDCCHAGGQAEAKGWSAIKSPLPPSIAFELGRGSGRVVIASSRKDELSWVGNPYSVFTGALLEGLAGYGAFEYDGYARVLDLAMYVGRVVPDRTRDRQHPIIKVANLEDNFAVAYYAGGGKEPQRLGWPGTSLPLPLSERVDAERVASWRRMLANRRHALMLIEERMSEYVEYQEIPLQLIDNWRRTQEQITELERKLRQFS